MKRHLLIFIAGVMTAFAVSGCSPEARYRTLSFFFDGVPNPQDHTLEPAGGNEPGSRQKQAVSKPRPSTHGPYAARLCEACHQRGGSNKLLLPVEELCLNCHDLNIKKAHTHGPVASGGCRVCHEPHGSGRQFLLSEEPKKFCFNCHNETEIASHEAHKDISDIQCTDCHDPHSSDNDSLLK